MPERFLHDTQVRAPVEEVGREGVAQGVRVGRRRRPAVDDPAGVAGREAPPASVEEGRPDRRGLGDERLAAVAQPPVECVGGGLAQRHRPLLRALAPDREAASDGVDIAHVEAAQLGDPQAAAVEHLEHGVVAQAPRPVGPATTVRRRVVEQGTQLVGPQDPGQPPVAPGALSPTDGSASIAPVRRSHPK